MFNCSTSPEYGYVYADQTGTYYRLNASGQPLTDISRVDSSRLTDNYFPPICWRPNRKRNFTNVLPSNPPFPAMEQGLVSDSQRRQHIVAWGVTSATTSYSTTAMFRNNSHISEQMFEVPDTTGEDHSFLCPPNLMHRNSQKRFRSGDYDYVNADNRLQRVHHFSFEDCEPTPTRNLPLKYNGQQRQPKNDSKRCDCPNCKYKRQNNIIDETCGLAYHNCHIPGCGKFYRKTSHLKAHLRWHSGGKRFACSYCSSRFLRSDHLSSHLKEAHNRTTQKDNSNDRRKELSALKTSTRIFTRTD